MHNKNFCTKIFIFSFSHGLKLTKQLIDASVKGGERIHQWSVRVSRVRCIEHRPYKEAVGRPLPHNYNLRAHHNFSIFLPRVSFLVVPGTSQLGHLSFWADLGNLHQT